MYKINDKLKNDILSKIPAGYSKLEKALFIYKELCKKLEYSVEYYFNEENVKEKFIDVQNLEYVDGEINKNVVCFTFNAIYLALLKEAGVCDQGSIDETALLTASDKTKLASAHEELYLSIDSKYYTVDATLGVLDNNDLVNSKFGVPEFRGWLLVHESDDGQEELDGAIRKVTEEEREVSNLGLKYVQEKGDGIFGLPIIERRDLFFRLLEHAPKNSLHGLNYLLKLKRALFTKDELDGTTQNMQLLFVKDAGTNQAKIVFFFNPEGYTNDSGFENFDTLEVYEIDLDSREVVSKEVEEIKDNFDQGRYLSHRGKNVSPNMFQEGEIKIEPVFKDNKPQYDKNQQPMNVEYWVRKYILTGEKVRWNKEKNCEE